MTANLLELQEMLRNLDMRSVRRVAQGQSGKAAQLLGVDEIKRRREQMQEAQANEAEQQMQQPPMVDQYLAMSQQMMGQAPAMPPTMPGPPQQGIGSMMPPQAPPQMASAPPPPQMASAPPPGPPVQMMAGGGAVGGGMDLMHRPKIGKLGIVEHLISTGMSREEAMAMAESIVGGDQSNALKAGGFIQKYDNGGTVVASDSIADLTPEEQEAAEDPGFLMEAMEWAKENPVDAAIMGINTASIAAMAVPVAGWAAGAGLRGAAGAIRIARALGPKAIKFLRNPVQTAGKAKFAKTASKIDDLAAPPMASSAEVSAARAAQMEARLNAPGAMRTTIRDGKVVQIPRTDAELITKMGRGRVYPAVGAATFGLTSLVGGDDEAAAIQAPTPPATPENGGDGDGYKIGDNVGSSLPDGNGDPDALQSDLGFLDRAKAGEFNPFFQFLTRAGLEFAAGEGENLGQDISRAGIAGMGEVERLADRDMAMKDRKREQDRQDAADAIAQRRLEMEEQLLPAQQALLESRASGFGTTSASAAQSQIENAIESVFGINYLSNPDAQLEQTRLLNIYTSQGPQALRQAIADLTGQSIAIDTVNQDKLNRILNPGVAGG
jgi:hypothetical protein